jgi:hypothetical protein
MAGGSSKGCQKLHWGILCVHHLGGYWPCVLCGCEIFLVCLGVLLFCGIPVFAWFSVWCQTGVHFHGGAWQSWMCGCCS